MSPLQILQEVFGSEIVAVLSDAQTLADVRTQTFGTVRLIVDKKGVFANVAGSINTGSGNPRKVLREAVIARIAVVRQQIRQLEQEARLLNNLKFGV